MASDAEELRHRLNELRDRAYRILEHAKHDDSVPPQRVQEMKLGIRLIESGWTTVENHPRPAEVAPFDLEAKLDEWERQFDKRERELGINE